MNTLNLHGNKKAFTLIETLCVLTIITTLILLTATTCYRNVEAMNEHLFIDSYRRQLKLIQLRSMTHSAASLYYYRENGKREYMTTASPFPPARLSPPKHFVHTTHQTIRYCNGIAKATTVSFETKTKRYLFKFQIGRGQYRYEEKELCSG